MQTEKIDLYEYFNLPRRGNAGGFLQIFCPAICENLKKKIRPCQLIIAGGGYSHISGRESEPVALQFLANGYVSALLSYSINTAYPAPLNEACMAVKYLRQNAVKLCINPQKICAVGFSAGGHLAGLLATLKEGETELKNAPAEDLKPNAVILSYPVITLGGEFAHAATKRIISGGGKVKEELSIDRRAEKNSAPAFIWHTLGDETVPAENSLLLARAYRKCGVPFELHLFEKGEHGLSLATAETNDQTDYYKSLADVGEWFNLALNWLRSRGFSVTPEK